ncbi:MAG: hypothetical protein CVT97_01185 [Bacteroidetes bacterium HGW-Bacteroidetes-14]|jgi:hypothetical protein|nr:MAG: hypothetical protein CVT97_01185 [Bacteroidetes bacterium HGW-Bacteroidetes-14]
MNEFFDINRFFKLVRKEYSERLPVILKIAVIFSLLLIGFWVSVIVFNGSEVSAQARVLYIYAATFLSMLMAPFNLYKSYNHPKKGIDYIVLPASAMEKFLSMLLNSVIVLPLATFLGVLLADTLIATVNPSLFEGFAIAKLGTLGVVAEKYGEAVIIQLGFIFGNFLFIKNKVFKTLMSAAGLYILFAMVIMLLLTTVFKSDFEALQNMNTSIKVESISELGNITGSEGLTSLLKGFYYSVVVIFYVICPVAFLGGTFYKMKTQQY